MKIGILGSGNVAKALAVGFAKAGHSAVVGSRDPENANLLEWRQQAKTTDISVTNLIEAVESSDVIIMALNWPSHDQVIKTIGAERFADKIVIDPANAFDTESMEPALALKGNSVAEHLQQLLPRGRVVKALNTVAAHSMVNPQYADGTPVMFIAGDDPVAKQTVTALLNDIGWTFVVDAGSVAQSSYIEATVPLLAAYNYKASNNFHGVLTIIEK